VTKYSTVARHIPVLVFVQTITTRKNNEEEWGCR